jgi:hypothetical protein
MPYYWKDFYNFLKRPSLICPLDIASSIESDPNVQIS